MSLKTFNVDSCFALEQVPPSCNSAGSNCFMGLDTANEKLAFSEYLVVSLDTIWGIEQHPFFHYLYEPWMPCLTKFARSFGLNKLVHGNKGNCNCIWLLECWNWYSPGLNFTMKFWDNNMTSRERFFSFWSIRTWLIDWVPLGVWLEVDPIFVGCWENVTGKIILGRIHNFYRFLS